MSRVLEESEFESAVTAIIAALSETDEASDVEHIKHRIAKLNLGKLLCMTHEHEITDELLERCMRRVKEYKEN